MKRELIHSQIKALVQRFESNKYHYLSRNYLEEEVKIDFINPLFEALGWDVRNTKGLSPFERDVVVEKGETLGRPDYNFRIDGQTKFFIEVKAPHEPLHKINHVLQAKSYAWNTKSVFIVLLTDFEEFRLFDATIKPDPKHIDQGLIFELTYDQYSDNLDKLILLSKEEVEKGSLDKLILKDTVSKRLRKPVDESFLEDISRWREELAKDIYKNSIKELEDKTDKGKLNIQVKILNEAVQKVLDRLIFIRIAEDRKIIEPKSLLDEVEWWKAGGKRRNLQKRLTDRFLGWNQDFNGEILKPGPCDVLEISSGLLAKIIEGLYFPKCPYRFEVIGVELLGSIYERYLGKTIRVTPRRIKIEEKQEVRKAGGVYYTPQFIVDYIVKNTVGKKIKGKKPKQIEEIRILDPACGSGSFLLTAFQILIDYHLEYYEKHPEESGEGKLFPDLITDFKGEKRLSIEKKAQILKNNILGVDIDPQAVEITMMSLYLKCLEGEKDLPRKKELLPSLLKNVRCGNSLVSYDVFDQLTLFDEEERDRINPFDWYSLSSGFGKIMNQRGFDIVIGNPPYGMINEGAFKKYFSSKFKTAEGRFDKYELFIEQGLKLIKRKGILSFIIPNTFLSNLYSRKLREQIREKFRILEITNFGMDVFNDPTIHTCIVILSNEKKASNKIIIRKQIEEITELNSNHDYKISQEDLGRNDNSTFDIFISPDKIKLFDKISNQGKKIGDICYIRQCIKTGNDSIYVKSSDVTLPEPWKPSLRGKSVDRYIIKESNLYLKYGNWLARNWKNKSFYETPKIAVRETSSKIIATVDYDNRYFLSSLYSIYPKNSLEKHDLRYFLGILNSKLTSFFIKLIAFDLTKGAFTKMRTNQLARLPIKLINFSDLLENKMYNEIIQRVDFIIKLNKKMYILPPSSERDKIEREIQINDDRIDELAYELYGITKEEIKIIEEGI